MDDFLYFSFTASCCFSSVAIFSSARKRILSMGHAKGKRDVIESAVAGISPGSYESSIQRLYDY
eukprot:scaffold4219_cov142-Skeletonema_menzelii.AAC.9